MQEKTLTQVFLPVKYNPDESGKAQEIEENMFRVTAEEISRSFSGGGFIRENPEPITGVWVDKDEAFWDSIIIIEFDIDNTSSDRRRVIEYVKNTLLGRFRQKAIYVRFVPNIEGFVIRVDSDFDEL